MIKLNDTQSFTDWANSQLPFINAVNDYLKDYETEIDENKISQLSTEKILAMQEILYGYFAALVEPYSKSEMYRRVAVARETRKNHEKDMPPSVAKTVAEETCGNEIMINEILHRLNSTIDKLLIVLSVRLSYEKSLFFGAGRNGPTPKPPF
jgi:hypothetical protein